MNLIVQVGDFQLIALSAVGEVETAVLVRREQLCVFVLSQSRQLALTIRCTDIDIYVDTFFNVPLLM